MGYSKNILGKILIIQLDEEKKTMNEHNFSQILEKKKINDTTFKNYAMIIVCTKNSKSGTNKHFQHQMKLYLEKNSFTLFSKIDATPYTTINHMIGRTNARTRIYVNEDKFVNLMSISSNNNFKKKFQNSYDKNNKNKLKNLRSELLNSTKKQNILSTGFYDKQKIDCKEKLYLSGYSINRKTTNHNEGFILVAFNFIAEPSIQGAIEYGLIINNNYNVTNSNSKMIGLFENKFSNISKDDYKKVLNIDYGIKNNSNYRKEITSKIIRLQLGNNTKNNNINNNNNNETSQLIRKNSNSQIITENNNPVHENSYKVMAENIQYILSTHLFYLFYRKSDGNYIHIKDCELFIYNKSKNNNKSKRGIDILLGFYIYYILFHKLLDKEIGKKLTSENLKNQGKKQYHNLFITMNMHKSHINQIDQIIKGYELQLDNDNNDIKFLNIIKVINNIKVDSHKIEDLINDLSGIKVFTQNELSSIPTRFYQKNKENVCKTLKNADLEDFFRYGKYNNSYFSSKNIRENFTGKLFKENLDSNYCGGKILNRNQYGNPIPKKPKIETIKELTTKFLDFIKESYTKRYADLIRIHGENFKYILA